MTRLTVAGVRNCSTELSTTFVVSKYSSMSLVSVFTARAGLQLFENWYVSAPGVNT